jgi:threonine/homoserine/homoserine lactone efflux protein
MTALGVCTGVLIWGAAGAVGLTAILTASEQAYDFVRIAGAAYLIWLGVKALLARATVEDAAVGRHPRTLGRAFRAGLFSNLLNPKIGAFYVSVLPQFIPEEASVLATSMLLAAVHALEGILWLFLVASLVGRLGTRLQRPRVKQRLEQLTGLVLVGLGLRLALDRR